ncbi:S-methyl-5-thioribose-1-phosphate isomerase [Streptomyces europaeiscabiei]|uniref:Methylthioribose-1-phosphate isomerase n=1 Tax=Streptomyces europaeiscabiei TaxID=146819 RepID=A0ABU4NUN6_9ACTN|nr:S-methyl-5-thioribose-1-phosphate isomerase [Streptomyces europaeiscabiei]MDX2763530.1 S-methyl-5-thioribose-1-phosphate isomerase [Streptomyces europaeiscabiei]MDX2773202.1 S-methyl-5-thioribose-1-phosphate isomerase [Streptomyces europaeiscabiei]MDX3547908.1 S-methyl-5-thioribose-1-phosphate isomerase [Streptomyces europaeiscabiei]MDX3557777.1 S-methyl-5-thioribose-1-phosphate isomerase [Streptomyces europaeiscabiei]MDX3668641.1 S-methyl-5-thioribose-1-phosphate isomerase [Streptomyces eu
MPQELRAVDWTGNSLALIDQTVLPHRTETVEIRDVDALVSAIQRLVVRGAPAIGAAGAYGVALALLEGEREGRPAEEVRAAVARVREARPTAVNLMVCVDRVMTRFDEGLEAVLEEAAAVQREDVDANRAMGAHGADWLLKRVGVDRPLRILTHCNTGALATAGWGTALGVIRELHARGRVEVVYADETRPLLQGSRLTAWELVQEGIPHYVQADGAAAGTILRGEVDAAIVGADRIAANGDTANKVGTVGVALACADAGIPFLVAAPTTTVDPSTASGADIHIELRGEDEVLEWGGVRTAPAGSRGHNPAFDVTPGRLVTGLVTERGVLEVSAGELPGERLR